MPKRNTSVVEDQIDYEARLRLPKNDFLSKVTAMVEEISVLEKLTRNAMEFKMWQRNTETLLLHAFGARSKQLNDFKSISYFPLVFSMSPYDEPNDYHESYLSGLQTARECLLSIVNEVQEFYKDSTREVGSNNVASEDSRKIFVVHGRDTEVKETVARFLENLDLEPVILHEQSNGGKMIIEKFEANSYNVAFAVILITPDDMGRANTDVEWKPRARQNVVLELGYFIGKLGRSRVCALRQGEVEDPSDMAGIVYVPYDSAGGWKIQLCRELQAAGLTIDAQKILTA